MKQTVSKDYLFNNLVHSKIFRTKFLKYLVQVFLYEIIILSLFIHQVILLNI